MCYHTHTPSKKELRELLGDKYVFIPSNHYYHVSGFTYPDLPVITAEQPFTVAPMHWGLIPGWAADKAAANEIRAKTLNATCEGIFEKNSFKASITHHRCLIFVDGFFEWQHAGTKKIPWYIYAANEKPMTFGGIYSRWTDKTTGEVLETCSIITTPANELMAQIHNTKKRMPLILDNAGCDLWLDTKATREAITDVMRPAPDNVLKAHKISGLITSRTKDSNVPEVILPVATSELFS